MSQLKAHEKAIFGRLFDRGGYVLDFNDRTFAEFFREHGLDIGADKYKINGTSKMKRLRAFWELEPDSMVGRVLSALLDYACVVEQVAEEDKVQAIEVIARLMGKASSHVNSESTEQDFLKQEFDQLNLAKLNIDPQLQSVIEQRINEIYKSLKAEAALATIFLCGSTLEGLLLDTASKSAKQFNQAKSAQKDKEGNVKPLHEWTLESLINAAHETGLLSLLDFEHLIHGFSFNYSIISVVLFYE
ncbi:hypothetical protein WDW89_25065 [Deltaproteobacteria bacterium TL4]